MTDPLMGDPISFFTILPALNYKIFHIDNILVIGIDKIYEMDG